MADTTRINGAEYEYEYKLFNDDNELKLRDTAVVGFDICDNIFNPFADGYITLMNSYNYVEKEFAMRGDGNDKFQIKLKPKQDDNGDDLEYIFNIVSEQNYIDDATQSKNRKTYILQHVDMVSMKEMFPHERRYHGKAGKIIEDILEQVGLKPGEIDPGDLIIKEFPEYIIPTLSYRYIDVLFYVLQYYYKKTGEIYERGFLCYDRKNKEYNLKLLYTDFFAKYKSLIKESFNCGDLVSEPNSNPNNPPPKGDVKTFTGNVVSTNVTSAGTVISNTFFLNALITGYDHILGTSRTKKLRVDDVRELWAEKFVQNFSAVGGQPVKHVLLTDRKKSDEYKLFRLPFSYKDNINIVFADLITNFTLYNLQLNINVVGDVSRQSGSFINIFKLKEDGESNGDAIMLGSWFVTSVRHIKIGNTYRNEILGVKTYAGPDFSDSDATI